MNYINIILLTIVGTLYIQNIDTCHAKSSAHTGTNPETEITNLNKLGWKYRKSFPDSSLYYCYKAIEKAEALGIKSTIGTSLNFIGVAYHYMGNHSHSYEYYIKAREYCKKNNDSLQYAHALNNLGRAYFSQGDLVKSHEYFGDALKIFETLKDKNGMSHAYKSMGHLFSVQKNQKGALDMFLHALSLRKEAMDSARITLHANISEIYKAEKDYENAEKHLLTAQNLAKELRLPINVAYIELWISKLALEKKDINYALSTAKKALAITENTKNLDLLARIYFQLGKVYFDLNSRDEAIYYFTKVIDLARNSGNLEQQKDSFLYISKIQELEKNTPASFKSYKQYTLLKDSINNIHEARSHELMETRLEIEKLENKYLTLQALADKNKLIIKNQKNKSIAQNSALVLLALLVITLLLVYQRSKAMTTALKRNSVQIELQSKEIKNQNKKIQQQNVKLQKRNKKLGELNKEQDTLMHIVAHDLKSPFQSIMGLLTLIELTGPIEKSQNDYLQSIKSICKSGVYLIRDLLDVSAFESGTRKLLISKINPNQAIEDIVNSFLPAAEAKDITIKVETVDRGIELDTDVEYLSRILSNLLSNALKYSSEGTTVTVKTYKGQNGFINFSIKDQGPGFNEYDKKHMYNKFQQLTAKPTKGEHSNGLGLAIVKLLSKKLNCKIELVSEEGAGSEFILKFPTIQQSEKHPVPQASNIQA